MWNKKHNFCLDIHFTLSEPSPYIKTHDRYKYNELEKIFDETDVLIVPSLWHETFGYTVLEALSFGVPVIITETVGAKDILADGAGIIIYDITLNKLYEVIKNLDVKKLKCMNQVIIEDQNIMTLKEMTEQIEKRCYMTDMNIL